MEIGRMLKEKSDRYIGQYGGSHNNNDTPRYHPPSSSYLSPLSQLSRCRCISDDLASLPILTTPSPNVYCLALGWIRLRHDDNDNISSSGKDSNTVFLNRAGETSPLKVKGGSLPTASTVDHPPSSGEDTGLGLGPWTDPKGEQHAYTCPHTPITLIHTQRCSPPSSNTHTHTQQDAYKH